MCEDKALTLPNGRGIVLTDDHKGVGVELYIEGVGLVRLPKGQSVGVGDFVLTCEAYDLDDDTAVIGVSGPPVRVAYRERPKPAQVRSSASPAPTPRRAEVLIPQSPETLAARAKSQPDRSTAGQTEVKGRHPARSSATTQPAGVDSVQREPAENTLRAAETALNNAVAYRVQFEELLRVETDICEGLRKRYYIVVMLYGHRLSVLGVKVPEQEIEAAIRKAKRLADRLDPFSVCPGCWTPGAKTLWERINAQE